MSLLDIHDLSVHYNNPGNRVQILNKVSLSIEPGEIVGLAGESGCGKTTLAYAITRLLPPAASISSGEIILDGKDVATLSEKQLRDFRWAEVSMVFQSAMDSLNPVITIEKQFRDVLLQHKAVKNADQARERTAELLAMVNISAEKMLAYSFQLSGGMRQRVVIAMALALNPKLIILDEPTTALDVVVQREILQRIYELKKQLGFSILFVTHDLSLMGQFCDRIGVMYAGEIIEQASAKTILTQPAHPYTQALIKTFAPIHGEKIPLASIPGQRLNLNQKISGCRFQDRCPQAETCCREQATQLKKIADDHLVACHVALRGAEHER